LFISSAFSWADRNYHVSSLLLLHQVIRLDILSALYMSQTRVNYRQFVYCISAIVRCIQSCTSHCIFPQ